MNNQITENITASGEELIEIIGVRFRDAGKVYYFSPGELTVNENDRVIVDTARGTEYGFAASGNEKVPASKIVPPLRPVIRIADERDTERYEANKKLEAEAFEICRQKILDHGLDMKLIEAEYTFDNSKLLFYFYAEVRVDFRDLVKDLASVFRTRIELRQHMRRPQVPEIFDELRERFCSFAILMETCTKSERKLEQQRGRPHTPSPPMSFAWSRI